MIDRFKYYIYKHLFIKDLTKTLSLYPSLIPQLCFSMLFSYSRRTRFVAVYISVFKRLKTKTLVSALILRLLKFLNTANTYIYKSCTATFFISLFNGFAQPKLYVLFILFSTNLDHKFLNHYLIQSLQI